MRKAIIGSIGILALLAICGFAVAMLGGMPTNADAKPPQIEINLATAALDASINRRASRANNPIEATDQNVIDGMKIYTMNCATCHGALDKTESPLAHSFYPPVPQLILHPLDDPQWHVFYAVKNGIRYTGMPSWKNALSEAEIWKVTAFVSSIEKLSPGVRLYWSNSFGVDVSAQSAEKAKGEHE
jgi:mono/diheme cytochrome c family protein